MYWGTVWGMGAVLLGLWPAATARADDQQLVEDYLKGRGVTGYTVRPIADDSVSRTFPDFNFFGVIFRQFPVAMLCPQTDLKCANVFFVKNGQADFVSAIPDLEYFFATQMSPAPSQETATDAVSAWLRLSEELKQDLFYTFAAPQVSYDARDDVTNVQARVAVSAGGQGYIEMLMTLGTAGSLLRVYEKSALKPGIRPICQATKLLDRDPIVRRMAEQDLLVMGRAAKPYLDQVRAGARPKLRDAIDRMWQRILDEGR